LLLLWLALQVLGLCLHRSLLERLLSLLEDIADMDISGGGTASTVPWGGITNLPDAFKQEPLSANASFDNAYKGGVTIIIYIVYSYICQPIGKSKIPSIVD
jgi:hypothetical protein